MMANPSLGGPAALETSSAEPSVDPSPTPARLAASPAALLRDAAGSPREMLGKALRLGRALAAFGQTQGLDARLQRLHELGYVDEIPTKLQLVVGSYDMLRFFIVPASKDYYAAKGIDFRFHQLLRFLDEPASLIDATGLLSTADNIIGHVMQVTHANPCYDLQLLDAHDGGLESLERQVEQMLDGTHPRARSIGAIIEDPGYHARLLEYVRAFRIARDAQAPIRDNVEGSDRFAEIERTFGTMPAAMRYFCRMPTSLQGALEHVATHRDFPLHLSEPR